MEALQGYGQYQQQSVCPAEAVDTALPEYGGSVCCKQKVEKWPYLNKENGRAVVHYKRFGFQCCECSSSFTWLLFFVLMGKACSSPLFSYPALGSSVWDRFHAGVGPYQLYESTSAIDGVIKDLQTAAIKRAGQCAFSA